MEFNEYLKIGSGHIKLSEIKSPHTTKNFFCDWSTLKHNVL